MPADRETLVKRATSDLMSNPKSYGEGLATRSIDSNWLRQWDGFFLNEYSIKKC
jgi:hypothetical protein